MPRLALLCQTLHKAWPPPLSRKLSHLGALPITLGRQSLMFASLSLSPSLSLAALLGAPCMGCPRVILALRRAAAHPRVVMALYVPVPQNSAVPNTLSRAPQVLPLQGSRVAPAGHHHRPTLGLHPQAAQGALPVATATAVTIRGTARPGNAALRRSIRSVRSFRCPS